MASDASPPRGGASSRLAATGLAFRALTLPGQRMQDADRPAHVETLPQPTRGRGPRVQVEPFRIVSRSEDLHGIAAHFRRRRNLGQKLAVRAAEPKLAARLSIELVTLLMDGAVMPATEQSEIRERGGAAVGPVTDVMALTEANPAAREAAASVPMVKRPP